jgi:hypothetical protein
MGTARRLLLFCICYHPSAAWQIGPGRSHRPQHAKNDALNDPESVIASDDTTGRRRFLLQLSSSFALPLVATADEDTAQAVKNVMKEEQDLDSKLKQEETDETKSIEDTKKLIDEIKDASNKSDEELSSAEKKIVDDTDKLIDEEEQIVGETQAMITEIEAIESEAKQLDTLSDKSESTSASEKTQSEEFVNKLKQRVEEKEDLITRLKRESEMFRDPVTGKFKPLSQDEFKKRALKSETDYDYLEILKDSITKNEEFERDLEAFEGLLERNFGGIMKELKKDEDAVENDFGIIKDGADAIIKQIRKLF